MISGVVVPIADKQFFDFSFLATSSNQTQVLARAINVIPFRRLGLLTRIHVNGLGTSASFDILIQSAYPSAVDQESFTQAATITRNITSVITAPAFLTDFADDMGPYVQISLRGNQATVAATRVQAQLSIGLLLRQSN